MNRQDWVAKLTSRKFWMAVAGLVTGIVGFVRKPSTDAEAITSLIMALGSVVAYCIAEGLVDAAHGADGDVYLVPPEEKEQQ